MEAATRLDRPASVAIDFGSRWITLEGPTRLRAPGGHAWQTFFTDASHGDRAVVGRMIANAASTAASNPSGPAELVVAVPDHWYTDEAGVLARERLHDALTRQGVVLTRCLTRAEGALASLAETGRADGPVLLCDLEASRASLAYGVVRAGQVTLVDIETLDSEPGSGGIDDLLRAVGERNEPENFEQLLESAQHRLGVLLPRAEIQQRYRLTRAVRAEKFTLSAGHILEWFRPVASALATMVATLVRRQPAAAAVSVVALMGGLARFPLVARTVLDALGSPRPRVTVLESSAVVVGAAAVARRSVDLVRTARGAIGMPVHQLRGGELVADRCILTRDASEMPIEADRAGSALVLQVGEFQPPAGAQLVVQTDRTGRWEPVSVRPDRPVPPGRYTVGLWPVLGALGALVLRPRPDGEPWIFLIDDPREPSGQ